MCVHDGGGAQSSGEQPQPLPSCVTEGGYRGTVDCDLVLVSTGL